MPRRVSLLLPALAVALASAPEGATQPARGLDHDAHARSVAAAKETVVCTSCHDVGAGGELRGKLGHAWCFGECHDAPAKLVRRQPYSIARGMRRLCETCHSSRALDGASNGDPAAFKIAVAPAGADEFETALSHRAHSQSACKSCHPFTAKTRRPHRRCTGCHDREPVKATHPMAACASCHVAAVERDPPSPFAVAATFSHRKHEPRVRAAAGAKATCASCHAGVETAETMDITAPTKSACAECHDGTPSFPMTVGCRRCHSTPATLGERVRAPARAFTHESHQKALCADCHDEAGRFTPQRGHALCATDSCHAGSLSSRAPVTCSSCHVGSEPWLPQHIDPPTRIVSDFGTAFDHARHRPVADTALASCTACHVGDPNGPDTGLSKAHASCAGAACHDAGSRSPALSECDKCHRLAARVARRALADSRPWAVRQTFAHRQHRQGVDGAALACTACHDNSGTMQPGRDLPAPNKKTCVGCHDGVTAFKVTGHGCRRCHRRSPTPARK